MEEKNLIKSGEIVNYANKIDAVVCDALKIKGEEFADEIEKNFVTGFKKEGDKMVHVSTFTFIDDEIYMTYYANPITEHEDPYYQTARLVYCKNNDLDNKVYLDLQKAGDTYDGKIVDAVYDTILMQKDNKTLYLMWTACLAGDYYRLYRTFNVAAKELGEINANRLIVKDKEIPFCFSGIQKVFTETQLGYKKMYSDIGIMQKLSYRIENGEKYYYTGAYSGDFNFIIKSRDLITWEFVAMPDFINLSKWENAVYVAGDKCFYFVRQQQDNKYGFLTCLNLNDNTWEPPVLIEDCQSRSDFIFYNDNLYLFHAPVDREHIGVVKIDMNNISESKIVFQAKMKESCFYPYIQYGNNKLYMSYTMNRKQIKLAEFTPDKYFDVK